MMKFDNLQKIRYIKLGEGGKWARDCFDKGIIRLGFSSGSDEVFNLASQHKWDELEKYWLSRDKTSSVAKNFTNQTREFFVDSGSTLWVTFEDGFLYYCFSDGAGTYQDFEFQGKPLTSFKKVRNGWTNLDANENKLLVTHLSGMITKTQAYRGTICQFSPQPQADEYLKNRLSGLVSQNVYQAEEAKNNLLEKIQPLIKALTPQDFEILCELIFSNSGWRRTSKTGGIQKTIDIELQNPVTGDTAFVQVKTSTSQKEFETYISQKRVTDYDRMFYVYHTGQISSLEVDVDISVWDLNKVAEQVVNNGLIDWVIAHSK